MVLNSNPKRLLIFFFYDKDGIIDRYVPLMLKDLRENCEKIIFVSNGVIPKEQKDKLNGFADVVIERENVGFDVWAYKEALFNEGFDNLCMYDEVVMMNHTIMGPVRPSKEMFDEMAKRDLDFWGLSKFYKTNIDFTGLIDLGYIPDHLQSHFVVVRKTMIESGEFEKYFAEMPMINSYDESVAYHETKFTRYFEDLGYKCEAYIDSDDLHKFCNYPMLLMPKTLAKDFKSPYIKRRCFFHTYEDSIGSGLGEETMELMRYLKDETSFDTDLIWENILREYNMQDIKNNLHLNFTFPDFAVKTHEDKKIALVFHAYFPGLVDSTVRYVNAMPDYADIYITTDTDEKKEVFEKAFKNSKFNKVEVLKIENRGRDVSALLVAAKPFVFDYDYVCFAHDKKVTQLSSRLVGKGFAYSCLENILESEGFVENIIEKFENESRLGMLMPPPPFHSNYFFIAGNGWTNNFANTKALYDELHYTVDIDEEKDPVTPLGTMFWFRPAALKPLFDRDYDYSDFPPEPNKTDNTILHAIERIYGFTVQQAGYYPAYCMSQKAASVLYSNAMYTLSDLTKMTFKRGFVCNYPIQKLFLEKLMRMYDIEKDTDHFKELEKQLDDTAKYEDFRLYLDTNGGFSDDNSVFKPVYDYEDNFSLVFSFSEPINLNALRFDPGEDGCLIINNLEITLNFQDDSKQIIGNYYTNGLKKNGEISFYGPDPQIIYNNLNVKGVKSISVCGTKRREVKSAVSRSFFNVSRKIKSKVSSIIK